MNGILVTVSTDLKVQIVLLVNYRLMIAEIIGI